MKIIYNKLFYLFLFLPLHMLGQSTISGTVNDMVSKQPISGANIKIKESGKSISTGFDGGFQLVNVNVGDKITVSFMGYKSKEFIYDGQKTLNIFIAEDANTLKEVVVQIGYGGVKRKDLTGSTTQVTAKDFNKGAVVTAENLLNGRVAGVTINTSGAPGSGSEIRIRGGSSLFASNDPLIVIDGLPVENATGAGSTSFLASINPSTIESFTVLKDASATAIYGSRASNGVILITTKKGGKKLSIDYNFQYGFGELVKPISVFDATTFRKVISEKQPGLASGLGNANTDWQKEIYRKTLFYDNNLTIKGNLLKIIPSRLTFGNTSQDGLRLTNRLIRNTIGLALNPSFFNDHLKLKLNANYVNERNRFADGVEGSAIRFDPTQPVYDSSSFYEGFFEYYDRSNNQLLKQTIRNPVAQLLQTNDSGNNNRVLGNFEIDYRLHFLPELRAVVNLGFDQANGERTKIASNKTATSGASSNINYGTNEFTKSMRKNKLLDAYLTYNKNFKNLFLDATGGYSYQKWDSYNFQSGNINDPNLSTGPNGFPNTTIDYDRILVGFFGRTNLNFKDKYLLTLSYRREGSSKFDPDNRWGNFPAVAFAWKIKQDIFKESKVVSDLKLRLGYGITGQQDVPNDNDYIQQYRTGSGTSQYYFGTKAVPIAVSAKLSSGLKWEETSTSNIGLDYGFLNNRISGAIEVFYKESKDLLARVANPDGSNFTNRSYKNIGNFTTKGIEFSVNAEIIKRENLNWNINFNASAFKRKISQLNNVGYDGIRVGDNLAGTGTQGQVHQVGYAPNSFFLYKQLFNSAGKPIEGAFADLNGDGIINSLDKYIYRNPDPKATFGFASSINYHNIDFSFNLRASVGNRVFNDVDASRARYSLLSTGEGLGNLPTSVIDTGFTTVADANLILSDLYVENASFLKLDNFTLGYTFSKWFNNTATLRFFTGCQNVLVITKYTGLDPEITNNGVDNTIYPRQRSFLFGANLKF
jgi:TonB-dependent starch-binding outer membrane protein SusC